MVLNTVLVTIVDGVKIAVPDTLKLITPYVLFEQQDWFEDEIKFLRRLLQPGYKVVDIGANFGVYTLSMAKAVGPAGRVWAFEPTANTADFLAEGIAANGFAQVHLERAALSNTEGMAHLSINRHPEANALAHGFQAVDVCEAVPVMTLDGCKKKYGWENIDFIKIDAEGEEFNILEGGKRFFTELSPLVQFEVKEGDKLNIKIIRDFSLLGYEAYRLVPGLNLLVPFDSEGQPDKFLLNLFCCKPDRASQLAALGFMFDVSNEPWHDSVRYHDRYGWKNTLARLPYGAALAVSWQAATASGQSKDIEDALALYAVSQDASLTMAERFCALEESYRRLEQLCTRDSSRLRLASLARVAKDYGARFVAVSALTRLSERLLEDRLFDLDEPFLVPGERFDQIPPGNFLTNWVLASVLEAHECARSFSSYFNDDSSLQRLEMIRELGFGSPEMQRRLTLMQQRCAC